MIVEGVYQTPVQEHAYLQPEAGVAYLDEQGRITVEVAGQWTHVDQEQIAHALGLPDDQVRVIYPAIGGAFGGREDMSVQITLALCVWRLAQRGIRRPVKTIWSREESMFGHGKRHRMKLYAKWGAKRDGTLVAAEVKAIADGGAYMYTSNKVLGNTTLTCTGPYEIPHVAVDTYAIYTNHVPGAAFRGFGGPQGHFEAEGQMDKLAEALGMDPVELRLKNILTEDKLLTVGTPIPGGRGPDRRRDGCSSCGGRGRAGTTGRSTDRSGNVPQDRRLVLSVLCLQSGEASALRRGSRTSGSPSATRRTATPGSRCAGPWRWPRRPSSSPARTAGRGTTRSSRRPRPRCWASRSRRCGSSRRTPRRWATRAARPRPASPT